MMGNEKRRSERLAGRFVVVVREKLAAWVTTTEDVSARGCRIELRRPLTPGMLVQLVFDRGAGQEPLVAHGQVAWARKSPPHSAGIAFLSAPRAPKDQAGAPGAWIDRMLSAYVSQIDGPPAHRASAGQASAPTPVPGTSTIVGRVKTCPIIVPPVP